jgi:uncharacterized protein Smg (DUF494 family)
MKNEKLFQEKIDRQRVANKRMREIIEQMLNGTENLSVLSTISAFEKKSTGTTPEALELQALAEEVNKLDAEIIGMMFFAQAHAGECS